MTESVVQTTRGLTLKMIRGHNKIEIYIQGAAGRFRLLGVVNGEEFWRAISDLYRAK